MRRHLTLLWMALSKLWLSRAVWYCLIWCQRYNWKQILNLFLKAVLFPVFAASFLWNSLPKFLCSKLCHFGALILKNFHVINDLRFLLKKFSACLIFIFVWFCFLADYSPCEHPCAGFPLISSRGRSDKALECHPACYDVCTEGEAGD